MRDGDGDGKCREENGKWVPCPPGVTAGSNLRNGKPIGATISEIVSSQEEQPSWKDQTLPISQRVQIYIDERRNRAKARAAAVQEAANTQVSRDSIRAARQIVPPSKQNRDVLKAEYEAEYGERPNPEDFEYETDYEDALNEWEFGLEDFIENSPKKVTPEQRKIIQRAFSHEFTGSKTGDKYFSEVISAYSELGGGITIDGYIFNKNGERVGQFTRTIFFAEDDFDGIPTISHDSLSVSEDYRGDGIASTFNAMNERLYREMGMLKIRTHGISGEYYNGATHWPANGFEIVPDERQQFLQTIQDGLDNGYAIEDEEEIIRKLLRQAQTDDSITAGDLVQWDGATKFFQDIEASFNYERYL